MIVRTGALGAMLGLLAVLSASGCSTVADGLSQDLAINSEPAGAVVTLSNGQTCTTPCSLTIPRDQELVADIVKPGCRPAKERLYSVTPPGDAGWFSSSVLYGAADYLIGSAYRVTPNPLNVHLYCKVAAQTP